MLTFKAQYVKSATVQQRQKDGVYKNKRVALVKLNPKSTKDYETFDKIRKNWATHNRLMGDMFSDIKEYLDKKGNLDGDKRFFYVLTTQKGNFSELESDKILGVTELTNKPQKYSYIDFIQVNPEYIKNKNLMGEYRGVGTALVNSMKKLSKYRDILLNALPEAIKFYIKLGFKVIKNDLKEPLMFFRK